jgi:hypothetical protein
LEKTYLNLTQRHQVFTFRFLLFPTGLQVQPLLDMPAIKDELKSWEESGMFLSWLTSDLAWLGLAACRGIWTMDMG